MKSKNLILLSYIFCLFCIAKKASGQSYYNGMGGAGSSIVSATEASLLNPALLGYIKSNHFHSYYFNEDVETTSFNQKKKSYGISIVDTQTSDLFPGSFVFLQSKDSVTNEKEKLYSLSIGRREYNKVSFGLSFKRLEYSSPLLSKDEHDVAIGITYSPLEVWGLSLVVDNVTNGDYLETEYVLATHYIYDPFLKLSLELSKKDGHGNSRPDVKTGFALPLADWDLTFGYKNLSGQNLEYFTSGFVWRGPRLGFSYAYQDLLGSGKGNGHFIDLGFFF